MSSRPGIGAMLSYLGGNEDSVESLKGSLGKEIKKIQLEEKALTITFADDSQIELFDDGQSCCERRYMHTDDELSKFVGSKFTGASVREGAEERDEYGEPKDSEFLIIDTSSGSFTIVNYNEHNGYYGGFSIKARRLEKTEEENLK
jgi:hypothetical protein